MIFCREPPLKNLDFSISAFVFCLLHFGDLHFLHSHSCCHLHCSLFPLVLQTTWFALSWKRFPLVCAIPFSHGSLNFLPCPAKRPNKHLRKLPLFSFFSLFCFFLRCSGQTWLLFPRKAQNAWFILHFKNESPINAKCVLCFLSIPGTFTSPVNNTCYWMISYDICFEQAQSYTLNFDGQLVKRKEGKKAKLNS